MESPNIMLALVSSQEEMERLKQSVANYTSARYYKVLCVTNNDNLYVELRNYFAEVLGEGRYLVEFLEKENLSFDDGKLFILRAKYIFLWDNQTVLSDGVVSHLIDAYSSHSKAGLIAANNLGGLYYEKSNLYEEDSPCSEVKIEGRFVAFDVSNEKNFITTYQMFSSYEFELGSVFDYGLTLRKMGYSNYLDTTAKIGR